MPGSSIIDMTQEANCLWGRDSRSAGFRELQRFLGVGMLETKNLSKTFDGNCVLKGINLTIKDGEVYGLIGANG